MADTKKYEVLKPITLPGGAATNDDGEPVGACIMDKGTINLDPGATSTISWLENKCIKEKGGFVSSGRGSGRGK